MERHRQEEDAARRNVNKEDGENIPIQTKKDGSTAEDLWFISKRGRALECFHCTETGHWPAECRRKKRTTKIEPKTKTTKAKQMKPLQDTETLLVY
ncbi:hypothetical protein RRG08_013945 [Elysia crispata]|uniref:CCHC-type domain-containing protein n=1 Tax=Elysia crispata TaxID=231223 RepID=A0AAE1ADK2_9GAST|nr:hypothetical protein RRG08_013945 [Elysia crispata]